MLDRYIIIDIDQMITDYEDNKVSLEALREQYHELCEKGIGSIDCSKDRVQTSPTNDGMINTMVRKETLEHQIEEYTLFFTVYDPAWGKLTEEEKFILMQFVMHRRKQMAIDNICERFGIEIAEAYRRKNSASNRFRRLMFG